MPCTDRVNKMNLKAIHKTEVTLYLTACHYLDKNKLFWYRIFKNIKVLFVKLLWAHFKYGIVIYVPHNQRLNFLKKCDINSFRAKWPKTDFPDCKNGQLIDGYGIIVIFYIKKSQFHKSDSGKESIGAPGQLFSIVVKRWRWERYAT